MGEQKDMFDTDDVSVKENKVEFKFQGQVVETLDWNVPEERKRLIDLGHKGILYNKKMHDISENEKRIAVAQAQVDAVNKLIDEAKTDDTARDRLIETMEKWTGKPFTKGQKESITDEEDIANHPVVKKLMADFNSLKESQEKNQAELINKEMQIAHDTLEKKFTGKDGSPIYDRKKVEDFLDQNPIFNKDVLMNFEQAYFLLNKEKILEFERTKSRKQETDRKDKIDKGRTETGEETETNIKKKMTKDKNYDDVVRSTLEEAKAKGQSFYTPD